MGINKDNFLNSKDYSPEPERIPLVECWGCGGYCDPAKGNIINIPTGEEEIEEAVICEQCADKTRKAFYGKETNEI